CCPEVKDRAGNAKCGRAEKIGRGTSTPMIGADHCANTHDRVTHQVIGADHLTAPFWFAVTDDEGFARGIAKFFHAANKKGDHQRGKAAREKQYNWEKCEHDEGSDDKRFASLFIGKVRTRNDA